MFDKWVTSAQICPVNWSFFSVMAGKKYRVKHVSPSAQYTVCFKKFQTPFLTYFNSYTYVLSEIPKSESQTI